MLPIIAISAGHYYYTPGKRCLKKFDPNETREWVLNARIAEYLTRILDDYECEILRLDDPTGQKQILIQERARVANKKKADYYIAIHANAAGTAQAKAGNWSGGGVVVYHYPKQIRKEAATRLYNDIISYNGLRGNRCTPIKATNSLYEITAPNMPAFLIENGFMDSSVDTPQIILDSFALATAQGIAKFLINELKLKEKCPTPVPQNPYPIPTRTLKLTTIKMKGEDVKWLQWELNRIVKTCLDVDGVFGKLTRDAVIKLQKQSKTLEIDGICGPATRAYILNC